jgi:two-component system OmpR family sensor kinase
VRRLLRPLPLGPLRGTGGRLSASFDRLPIRLRLAGVSALLTFVILCAFAVGIGSLTVHRIRSDFNRQVADNASELSREVTIKLNPADPTRSLVITPPLADFANTGNHVVIRIFTRFGEGLITESPKKAPSLGQPRAAERTVHGYRVVVSPHPVPLLDGNGYLIGEALLQYGRRVSDTEATVKRVELFLLLGVLAGSGFALLAGMAIARRAMAPIAELTSTAAEIARTRDPSQGVPQPLADDEVAVLARTLEGMLKELDAARGETEAMLARQRRFVADASHELRTPLTSVLANLELLAESLHGEEGEAASSALRSSRRMRRLVADLLLLARTDTARAEPREPCDLARIVVEAAGELGSVSSDHEISLDVQPALVMGATDELHRLTINLLENALRHTPAGTEIKVSTRPVADGSVELIVKDNGPGIPPELVPTLFERFVRGAGDRGGSFGLGLAIVQAVAGSHGGSVTLRAPTPESGSGACFVVSLPGCSDLDDDGQHHRAALEAVID